MAEEAESQSPTRNLTGLVVVSGILVVIFCALCVAASLAFQQNVMPGNSSTRTALVLLFSTPVTSLPTHAAASRPTQQPPTLLPIDGGSPGVPPTPSATITQARPTPTFSPPIWLEPPQGIIAFTCNVDGTDQICAMNADGSNTKQITQNSSGGFYPVVAPEGKSILFSSREAGNYNIFEINTDGTGLQQLTANIGNLYSPDISLNGNRIVFADQSGGQPDIWIMKRDGGNARPVSSTPLDGQDPSWAPDNNRISYTSSEGNSAQIYTIQASGGKSRQITKGIDGISGRSVWSPDGRWLAFQAEENGNREIYLIGVDGEDLRQITDGGDNYMPAFSPDGQWIVFVSRRNGTEDLYVMHPDGSEVTRLTGDPAAKSQPRWGPGEIR